MSHQNPANVEGFVLAGGRSSRMGQEKALMQLGGHTLVELALNKLRTLPLDAGPRIAGAHSDLSTFAPVVPDLHPRCGPLGGIETALTASRSPLVVFLPVDLPLLPASFVRWIWTRAQLTGALATIPRMHGSPHPLCAVYHRDLLPSITSSLLAGDYKVMPAVTAAARAFGSEAFDTFDMEQITSTHQDLLASSALPIYRWFLNCNTPQEMPTDALVWRG